MRNPLIEGLSGTGTTSVADELARRGSHAVHGDRELAHHGDPGTGEPSPDGGRDHWLWDVGQVRALVADRTEPVTFFRGGSSNSSQFVHLFDGVLVLHVDLDTVNRRLDARPPDEWGDGNPTERALIARWHRTGERPSRSARAG